MNKLLKWKLIVWVLCYFSMTSRHLLLESWYMSKPILHNHSLLSTEWLSVIDGLYLLSYAIGNFISGSLEDQYSLHILVSTGLITSAVLFWFLIFLGLMRMYSPLLFAFVWILQGFAQSTVTPGCISLLGHWFSKDNRGKVMGLFSSSASAGNLLGAVICGWLLSSGISWMAVMTIFSMFECFMGVLVYNFVKDNPDDKFGSFQQEVLMRDFSVPQEEISSQSQHKLGIPFMRALKIHNILNFAIAMACAKFLVYSFNMWLPYYLDSTLEHKKYIGILSGLFDLGGITGSIVCGWLGDRLSSRPLAIFLYLILSFPCLIFFALITAGPPTLALVIPLTGFFVGGLCLILGNAVPVDIAQNKSVENVYEAMATVAGIIDGSGGLGASIGVFIVGNLSTLSWGYVFAFMIAVTCVEFWALAKISYRAMRRLMRKQEEAGKG